MPKVIHFEIPIANPELSLPFYEKALGWTVRAWGGGDGYWLLNGGPAAVDGTDGALMKGTPGGLGTVVTIAVDSIEESRSKVAAYGGKVVSDVDEVPGVGLFCYCDDPEGNRLGLMQLHPREQ